MTKTTEYNKYKQVQIKTASPGKLILLLYQGAIGALKKACDLIDQKDYGGKGNCLIKAQDIIMELNLALDMSAGEISASLRRLNLYMYRRLVDANLNLDKEAVREVITIMEDLYGAWEQAVQENEGQVQRQRSSSRLSLMG